jgi:hypothetical protein
MSPSEISYTDFGGPSQVRAVSSLFSHRRILRFFFRCDLTASFLQHARKKIFVSNNTDKKNIVSDKCHKLCFYFLHGTAASAKQTLGERFSVDV